MKNYDRIRAHKLEGIETKKAHIVGGGIAGLASAVFLIDDGYMDGRNITIYESLKEVGGSMDAARNEYGYVCRGERELEPNMECLWYLCNKIPSIDTPGRTVLEETVDANNEHRIYSNGRLLHNQGQIYDRVSDLTMSKKLSEKMIEMMVIPESKIEDVTIDEFFGDTAQELYESSLWLCFHSMLAFKHYHSLIEMKRYMVRFVQHLPGIDHLRGQVETKHNEYDSIIKPVKKWLLDRGVTIINDCTVYDLDLDESNNTVLGIHAKKSGEEMFIPVSENEIAIVTIGSMTQNSSMGDNHTVAQTNRDTENRGLFSLWERLAKRDGKFGHPEKFTSDIDKTKWVSAMVTVRDYPELTSRIRRIIRSEEGTTSGAVTIIDSNWDISFVLYGEYYPDQPDNEQVFWLDTLYGERDGNYINKPSGECTGEEILTEFLYHLGLLDIRDEALKHCYISTCMMPYITSQFMPRALGDRPSVIPKGCTNLAFIGQYVELPGDVVFTVETSIRTAMMASYGLLHLDRPVVPLYEAQYDIRVLAACIKKLIGTDEITRKDLPPINPLKLNQTVDMILKAINSIPFFGDFDNIY